MTADERRLRALEREDDDSRPARTAHDALETGLFEIKRVIVGQEAMLERVLVALLAGGHVLLEVMQEHQVTIGHTTHPVPDPFLVLATQNPIESEGTYPLPEAQVDRFMFKLVVDYPQPRDEVAVVERSLS